MPLKARDAMSGSPSPWKVLAIMPRQATVRDRRLSVSVKDRVALIVAGSSFVSGESTVKNCEVLK